jgi:hypothetical protein
MHFAYFIGTACKVEDTLGNGSFTGIDMSDEGNITYIL